MKQRFKEWLFGMLGKDTEAVVVSFWSGDRTLARRMTEEIQRLVPGRQHFIVTVDARPEVLPGTTLVALASGSSWQLYRQLRQIFRAKRIGLAPVLFTPGPHPLRWAAAWLAPTKILAHNRSLERHHLRLRHWIASWFFLRGQPLDRIFLRPWWLYPLKRDRSVYPTSFRVLEGRPLTPNRPRIGVLSPYSPYPLSHGGAVRIFHLLREVARDFDVFLFAFEEKETDDDLKVLLEFCAKVVLVKIPRYREPRWSSLVPPEVKEYRSRAMELAIAQFRGELDLFQIEYTHLAPYGGDILVEHDVTFDLHRQVFECEQTLSARWDLSRWQRFEARAVRRFPCVVAMSEKDQKLLEGTQRVTVIENGVDMERFRPEQEPPGMDLLFIGSFRHFPNLLAYRFFTEMVWPLLQSEFPHMRVTAIAGPDHLVHWRRHTGAPEPEPVDRIRLLGFVRDVVPLYAESNLVLVPTPVSAGTNLKVLEAMATERAVVSTACGCAGLGLEHGRSVWIADSPEDFAGGVARMMKDPAERRRLAVAARRIAEQRFDWKVLGRKQRTLYRELIQDRAQRRTART